MRRDPTTLKNALAEIDRQHLRRSRRTVEGFPVQDSRAEIVVNGKRVVDFSSNDYLGLARHPAMVAAMCECATLAGAGSGASHLVTGHGVEHQRLEEELAEFVGRERALLFSTGYMANLAAVATLADRGEVVALDRLNHASLIDGTLLSGARFSRYSHGDPADAERVLKEHNGQCTVLATDGVFSMDGDIARLPTLARIARAYKAWLIVDDAHGIGVLGPTGRGLVEHFELSSNDVPLLVGTLGKAFGSFGAFIAGPADLMDLLVQKARTYIYTTALPQPVAAATRKSLQIMQQEPWRRERVMAHAARFRAAARQMDLHLAPSESPIQPVIFGPADVAVRAQNELLEAGFLVVAIRPPTVPAGTARLRIAFSAAHTEDQVDALLEALGRVQNQLPKRSEAHG